MAIKTMIVLGSGGHTAEMLSLLSLLRHLSLCPRVYLVASDDRLSAGRARSLERGFEQHEWKVERVARCRRPGQHWLSSIFTCLCCLLTSAVQVFRLRPRLLLANGPGTCVPSCLLAKLLGARVLFVESVCRVRSLSASGRLLYWFGVDVLVQWPQLVEKYPAVRYMGRLV